MSTSKRRANPIVKYAESLGYKLVRQHTHLVFRHPAGAQVSISKTPSDHRAMKNDQAQLRRSLEQAQARDGREKA